MGLSRKQRKQPRRRRQRKHLPERVMPHRMAAKGHSVIERRPGNHIEPEPYHSCDRNGLARHDDRAARN